MIRLSVGCGGAVACSLLLAGCGTYVPNIQEFPGDSTTGNQLVQAIVTNIKCELQDALQDFYERTRGRRTFLDTWGILTDLNLQIVEKGEVKPSVGLSPPSPASAVFTLGIGLNGSSEATRTNSIKSFDTVSQLRKLQRCPPELRGGPMLLQSNLKLNEWLISALLADSTGDANFRKFVTTDSVLTHEVKFEVATGAGLTPVWTLTRATINDPNADFLFASRTRTHHLTITIGPTDYIPASPGRTAGRGPARSTADAALASQIGVAVGNSLNRSLRR